MATKSNHCAPSRPSSKDLREAAEELRRHYRPHGGSSARAREIVSVQRSLGASWRVIAAEFTAAGFVRSHRWWFSHYSEPLA